jgi:hypothetical protein
MFGYHHEVSMGYRIFAIISVVLLTNTWALSQVPIDLSRAKEFRLAKRYDLGGQISAIAYNEAFCGFEDFNVITTGVSGRGRVTWKTTPFIDTTNIFDWLGIRSPYILVPLDYDGNTPIEYVNANGIIWRCSQGYSPFPLMPIDTVANDVCSNAPVSSADVDGDGYRDVITEIGRNGVTTRLILGGPSAGKGCERTLVVPVVRTANKYNQTKAFFKSAGGEWRLIQQERDSMDRAPRLQLYRVNFARTSSKPEVTFTPLGMYRGEDVSQIDEPFGELCVIVDSVNGIDNLLMNHRIGPPGSQWALERYVITPGEFSSSGEVVSGYNFYFETYWDLQYSLGTQKPVVLISSDRGGLFCVVDDLQHPIAVFDPTGTGAQPVTSLTAVNDQTGDGVPDIVVGGDGILLVVSLDTTLSSVDTEVFVNDAVSLRVVGRDLVVHVTAPTSVVYRIITVDGKVAVAATTAEIQAGEMRISLADQIRSLSRGLYLVNVRVGEHEYVLRFTY